VKYFGKYGFRRNTRQKELKTINICDIERGLDDYVKKGLIVKKGDVFVVELSKLGYQKLLGKGKVTKKFKFNADYASKGAVSKVEKNGGEVVLPAVAKDEKAEEEKTSPKKEVKG